ncbi:MFS transporter [Nonomuraea sp. NPDC003709]|uniref:MFS transporter n=1 Tax=Nonomuraea sp. NPDC003709 TaxID=3154450 RepID=UPI0033B8393B
MSRAVCLCTQAILADLVPVRRRAKYMGAIGAVFGLSSVAGPLLGGWITDNASWRWAFWINVPLGVAALAISYFGIRLPKPDRTVRLDYLGTILMAITVTSLVLVADWGGNDLAWDSPLILSLIAVTIAGSTAFVLVERRAAEPLIAKIGRYKGFVVSGLVIVPAGVYLLSTLNADSPVQLVCAYLALLGTGMGLLMQNLVLAVQNAFPRSEVGTATSANNFFREIAATIATAAVGALFAERLTGSLSGLAPSLGGTGTDSLTPALVRSLPESVHDDEPETGTADAEAPQPFAAG